MSDKCPLLVKGDKRLSLLFGGESETENSVHFGAAAFCDRAFRAFRRARRSSLFGDEVVGRRNAIRWNAVLRAQVVVRLRQLPARHFDLRRV